MKQCRQALLLSPRPSLPERGPQQSNIFLYMWCGKIMQGSEASNSDTLDYLSLPGIMF